MVFYIVFANNFQVQDRLIKSGYHPGTPDGYLGIRTIRALKEFQKNKGIIETGLISDETLTALGISLVANIKISYFKINQAVAEDLKKLCIIVAIQLIFFKLLPVPKETTRYTIILKHQLQRGQSSPIY